jgi:SAM-dependent methyltransferase
VLDAFRARGVEPDITVVDRCETPLMLHRWYAERVAGKVDARRCDMLEFSAPQAFDVVCSHASYGPFPPGQRATLFARWHDLLRPGGRIITVINRARPDSTAEPVTFTPAERAAFHAAVLQAAGKLPASLATDPAELARRADTYASRHSTYPVRSAEEIREMLERSGFRIEHAPSATAAPGSGEGLTAPSTRGGAGHTGIVATRL